MAAFLLNRIRRIKRGSLPAKENHVPHPKGVREEAGDENIFLRARPQRFCRGIEAKTRQLWPSHLENVFVLECHRRKCGMDVSRGKNICKEHLVNIWFFGDSFITLKAIQRGVLLTYGLAL